MGWWSDLFKVKDVVIDSGLPKISATIPMPKVKPTKPDEDIREPVISFIECVRENPERFRIKSGKILDKKIGKWFVSNYYYDKYQGSWQTYYLENKKSNTSWMSVEEIKHSINELTKIQKEKVKNFKNKQRQKYIDIYVTKEND